MEIQQLIDDYTQWLRKEITFEKIGEYYEITTPFLDNANDYIQIYVRIDGDTIHFSDDGFTLNQLYMNGFQLTSSRKNTLVSILRQYGVTLDGNTLESTANVKTFAQRKHMFLQAIIRVDDMYMTSRNKSTSYFLDDVQDFFNAHDIFYTDNVQFTGTSGFSHNYDFLLQRSKTKPERLCRTMNNPNKTNMSSILFAWNDTKPARRSDSKLIVLLNDNNSIAKGVEEGFLNYDAEVIKWSQIDTPQSLALLTA
jgi:hypothetical protein